MKLVKYSEYLASIVNTDDLMLYQQGISRDSAQYTSMRFQLFMRYRGNTK